MTEVLLWCVLGLQVALLVLLAWPRPQPQTRVDLRLELTRCEELEGEGEPWD